MQLDLPLVTSSTCRTCTLRASAITKFREGMTTIDEIVRVSAPD